MDRKSDRIRIRQELRFLTRSDLLVVTSDHLAPGQQRWRHILLSPNEDEYQISEELPSAAALTSFMPHPQLRPYMHDFQPLLATTLNFCITPQYWQDYHLDRPSRTLLMLTRTAAQRLLDLPLFNPAAKDLAGQLFEAECTLKLLHILYEFNGCDTSVCKQTHAIMP